MIFVLTAATSGLFDPKAADSANHQPRLLRVAGAIFDGDKEVATVSSVIKPDGFRVDQSTVQFHGVTQEMAIELGLPIKTVLSMVYHMARACDSVVMWNDFYMRAVKAELERMGVIKDFLLPRTETVILQPALTNLCRVTQIGGSSPEDYKWPSLDEAMRILLDEKRDMMDPLKDVRACLALKKKLETL
jgi:DNA polymerase-3 subunit epsilon